MNVILGVALGESLETVYYWNTVKVEESCRDDYQKSDEPDQTEPRCM